MGSRSWMALGMQQNHCDPSHTQGIFAQCELVPFLPPWGCAACSGCSSIQVFAPVKCLVQGGSAPGSPWHCRAELGQGLNQS